MNIGALGPRIDAETCTRIAKQVDALFAQIGGIAAAGYPDLNRYTRKRSLEMRKLQGLVLAFMVLAFEVPAIAAESDALKSGPAGAVEVKPGQPIELRALLSDTVVPSVPLSFKLP